MMNKLARILKEADVKAFLVVFGGLFAIPANIMYFAIPQGIEGKTFALVFAVGMDTSIMVVLVGHAYFNKE
jgi:hypothetical protein